MWVGLLTDRINNKLEKSNVINEHALNREPVPLNGSGQLNYPISQVSQKFRFPGSCLPTPPLS